MKQVSDSFKTILGEVLRPITRLYFEVSSDVAEVVNGDTADSGTQLNFDDTVAPIIQPKTCANEHYYAIVGDSVPVDDPNRICAPDDVSGTFPTPQTTVPNGVTALTSANTEVLIGNASEYYYNFIGFADATLCFRGLIPDSIRVERYNTANSSWETEITISNPDLDSEIEYIPADKDLTAWRRFYVKNSTEAGRFQLLWIRRDTGKYSYYFNGGNDSSPIVFENEIISNVNIDTETDLTSQTLPSYEMTVECLDVDEIYTPDSSYWTNQFKDGSKCYFKLGYDIGEGVEYVPLFYGKLTKTPTYSEGKITFNVAVEWRSTWDIEWTSLPRVGSPTEGTVCRSRKFADLINDHFDNIDIFADATDENNSLCNYYGSIDGGNARQLVANALGGYITAGIATVDIHNANNIQYKTPYDVLTRYEQQQATLESKPTVGKISVTRNENTVANASDSYTATAAETIVMEEGDTAEFTFKIPNYAFSGISYETPIGYSFSIDSIDSEVVGEDGMITVTIVITLTSITIVSIPPTTSITMNPTFTFVNVNNKKYAETEAVSDEVSGDVYTNDNDLVTNTYVAAKVKRVAHLVSDICEQYEIDVIQDYRYDLGDIVRVETNTDTFKTCVITGLKYKLPGSSGHVTCRKIFSYENVNEIVLGAVGLSVTFGGDTLLIKESANDACVVARFRDRSQFKDWLVVYGATKCDFTHNGVTTEITPNATVTDANGHIWYFYTFPENVNSTLTTNAPVAILPDYTSAAVAGYASGVKLIRYMFEEQGMTPPIASYSSSYTAIN